MNSIWLKILEKAFKANDISEELSNMLTSAIGNFATNAPVDNTSGNSDAGIVAGDNDVDNYNANAVAMNARVDSDTPTSTAKGAETADSPADKGHSDLLTVLLKFLCLSCHTLPSEMRQLQDLLAHIKYHLAQTNAMYLQKIPVQHWLYYVLPPVFINDEAICLNAKISDDEIIINSEIRMINELLKQREPQLAVKIYTGTKAHLQDTVLNIYKKCLFAVDADEKVDTITALLLASLRQVGIPARLVNLITGNFYQPQLPVIEYWNGNAWTCLIPSSLTNFLQNWQKTLANYTEHQVIFASTEIVGNAELYSSLPAEGQILNMNKDRLILNLTNCYTAATALKITSAVAGQIGICLPPNPLTPLIAWENNGFLKQPIDIGMGLINLQWQSESKNNNGKNRLNYLIDTHQTTSICLDTANPNLFLTLNNADKADKADNTAETIKWQETRVENLSQTYAHKFSLINEQFIFELQMLAKQKNILTETLLQSILEDPLCRQEKIFNLLKKFPDRAPLIYEKLKNCENVYELINLINIFQQLSSHNLKLFLTLLADNSEFLPKNRLCNELEYSYIFNPQPDWNHLYLYNNFRQNFTATNHFLSNSHRLAEAVKPSEAVTPIESADSIKSGEGNQGNQGNQAQQAKNIGQAEQSPESDAIKLWQKFAHKEPQNLTQSFYNLALARHLGLATRFNPHSSALEIFMPNLQLFKTFAPAPDYRLIKSDNLGFCLISEAELKKLKPCRAELSDVQKIMQLQGQSPAEQEDLPLNDKVFDLNLLTESLEKYCGKITIDEALLNSVYGKDWLLMFFCPDRQEYIEIQAVQAIIERDKPQAVEPQPAIEALPTVNTALSNGLNLYLTAGDYIFLYNQPNPNAKKSRDLYTFSQAFSLKADAEITLSLPKIF